ncbi:hypothetical protein [Acinetobacter baumannii]|uniref:hypothetical protein n=1 Tax=Acinetobacter baumannii TaxID=470 RepID=UPI000A446ACC|nr:hypothetical protein [Acinetobacter baumannii]
MSKDDHDKFVLFLIVVGFIVLVVCGLAWQGAGIFNLPFTVMLWTIIRLIIVVSLVFITGKFGLSREFTFPAAAVGLAFSLFPVLDHIALGYSAKNLALLQIEI